MIPRPAWLLALPLFWLGLPSPLAAADPSKDKPRDIGMVEKARAHLAQLDFTLSGDPRIIDALTRDDFKLSLDREKVQDFIVDRVCRESEPEAAPRAAEAGISERGQDRSRIVLRANATTYLFYFDQPHLTMAGRLRGLQMARDLVPKLITGGNRGMIISSGRELATVAPLTSDPAALLAALDRLDKDRRQWDFYATEEISRIAEVMNALNDEMGGGVERSLMRARGFQIEESWQMQKAVHRLDMVLGALADIDPPKAVLYFADTMRSNPGAHYLSLFSESVQHPRTGEERQIYGESAMIESDSSFGALTLDKVINLAAAHDIRLYTIQAEGLVDHSMSLEGKGPSFRAAGYAAAQSLPVARIHDAQDTLTSMALETGGQPFLNGVPASRIASRVLQDLSCVHLISFDPTDFPVDQPLAVRLRVSKPGVTVHARGRLVIQSESSRMTTRLLGAFAAPEAIGRTTALRTGVIPTGYRDGSFSALIQVAVPGSRQSGASWEVGYSVLTRGKVSEEASARLKTESPGTPLVLEREVRFPPGPYEIVAVARETTTDEVVSRQAEGAWPDPDAAAASVGPIAVIQPLLGGFLREGATHTAGFLAQPGTDRLRADEPTALVGLVCRERRNREALRAERRLSGETSVEFPATDLDFSSDRCVQIRDVVPAGRMGPGEFRYELRVLDRGVEIAKSETKFLVGATVPAGEHRDAAGR